MKTLILSLAILLMAGQAFALDLRIELEPHEIAAFANQRHYERAVERDAKGKPLQTYEEYAIDEILAIIKDNVKTNLSKETPATKAQRKIDAKDDVKSITIEKIAEVIK